MGSLENILVFRTLLVLADLSTELQWKFMKKEEFSRMKEEQLTLRCTVATAQGLKQLITTGGKLALI